MRPDRGVVRPLAVRLPIHAGNTPIDADLPVERGATLRIYEWRDYLADDVLDTFARRYASADVDVRVESFTTMAEAVARLRRADGDFDVFFPTVGSLSRLVAEDLVRPLTHELLPNRSNLWPFFSEDGGPFYDAGQRYSVPYTVYSTGRVAAGLSAAGTRPRSWPNPYDAYWNERYRGAVGIYDDYREAIAMALLRRGEDPNTGDEAAVGRAVDDLVALADGVDVEVSSEGAYEELQTGEYAFQQSWSGDLLSAKRFGAAAADDAGQVAFTWPRGGIVGCDSRRSAPAVATPSWPTPSSITSSMWAWRSGTSGGTAISRRSARNSPRSPRTSATRVLRPDDLNEGRFLRPLGPGADTAWQVGWQRFLAALAR